MENMQTIGFYGRSGQGVETAVNAFAKACFLSGFCVQTVFFPQRTRRNFTVKGYVKVDKTPILSKQIEDPDFYVLLDTIGLEAKCFKESSIVIFNSPEKIVFPSLKNKKIKAYFVDATGFALTHLKANLPNTVMLGALAKVFGKLPIKNLKIALEELPRENMAALEEGYRSVK